jgi:hypothetical protein
MKRIRLAQIQIAIALFVLSAALTAGQNTAQLSAGVRTPFQFAVFGDTRFTDPTNTTDTDPRVRQEIVRGIASSRPAFIAFGGDITLNGPDTNDWKVYDTETSAWRERKITVYPALGNHEVRGDQSIALENYFKRFPYLNSSRFYAVRAANTLLLSLDSSLDETTGAQGEWLRTELEHLPQDVDFVFVSLHYPPVTSAGDKTNGRGGSAPRPPEQHLAAYLENEQKNLRARIVVFASHVHNYDRHERGGVVYFVTGGGGAHAYPISRAPGDPFQSETVNYHYLLVEVSKDQLKITMHRLEIKDGTSVWTTPDAVVIPKKKS